MSEDFKPYIEAANKDIEDIQKKISAHKQDNIQLSLETYLLFRLQKQLLGVLGGSEAAHECVAALSQPPQHITADFAFPVFPLAQEQGRSPAEVAKEVTDKLNTRSSDQEIIWASAVVAGPFVNLVLKDQVLIESVLGEVKNLVNRYGANNSGQGKVALIEYSSPNIAKPIGVGHMRSTIIGQALVNVFESSGYTVIKHNYLGDWGTQFGKLAYAYELWGDEEMLKENPLRALKDLYVKFHEEAANDKALEEKGREYAARLESDDPELLKLWGKFRDISLEGFKQAYNRLGVSFDTYMVGEAYFAHSDEKDRIIDECLALRDICHIDQETGAVIIEGLKEYGLEDGKELPSFVLRKKDGTSLYLTRDLVALKERIGFWSPSEVYIVVGGEQELHFRQLFALAARLGILKGDVSARHISFGAVLADGKKMSTRKGVLVELESLLEESVQKSAGILKEKNRELSDQEIKESAEIIGVGSVIYNDLRQSREKNISFDWNRMLDFEGGSAAYLQYTAVRISSILGKVGEGDILQVPLETVERSLLLKLAEFPRIVYQVLEHRHPHSIATYLEELAHTFNTFYGSISVKDTEDEGRKKVRIQLILGVYQVLTNGLTLLGVKTPKKM